METPQEWFARHGLNTQSEVMDKLESLEKQLSEAQARIKELEAVNHFEYVFKQLRDDPELFYGYQAYIAMAIHDTFIQKDMTPPDHLTLNQGAENFLWLLCREKKDG